MHKFLSSIVNNYESFFCLKSNNKDSVLIKDLVDAERGHRYMMIKMRDLFWFKNDFEKFIYGLGFKLILILNTLINQYENITKWNVCFCLSCSKRYNIHKDKDLV